MCLLLYYVRAMVSAGAPAAAAAVSIVVVVRACFALLFRLLRLRYHRAIKSPLWRLRSSFMASLFNGFFPFSFFFLLP